MHLAVRLGAPLGLVRPGRADPEWIGRAVVGGAREAFYVKEAAPCVSVGAELLPFASLVFFGAPAGALAERHTPLEDLWGRAAMELVERLEEGLGADDPACAMLTVLEDALTRQARALAASPSRRAVREVLGELEAGHPVFALAARTGLSHRAFVEHVRAATGLAPKAYASVFRFQRALTALTAPAGSHAEAALEGGYADQAHFSREVSRRAGVSPRVYLARRGEAKNHVVFPR